MHAIALSERSEAPVSRIDTSTTFGPSTLPTPSSSRKPSRSSSMEDARDGSINTERGMVRQQRRRLHQTLNSTCMIVFIISGFFTSGMTDAVAFSSWNCFTGSQTGNTIFVALGIMGLPHTTHFQQYFKSITAIVSFNLGSLFFNILHRLPVALAEHPHSRLRFILLLSYAFQAAFTLVAVVLVTTGHVSSRPYVAQEFSSGVSEAHGGLTWSYTNYLDLLPIACLAIAASGQVCVSRVLGYNEMPTHVVSALYHDFTGDLLGMRRAWVQSTSFRGFLYNTRREWMRFACLAAFFLGALVGGSFYKSHAGMDGALWVVFGIRCLCLVGLWYWPAEQTAADVEEK